MQGESSQVRSSRQFDLAVATIVILWYCAVYFAVRPLTAAPVQDSWVYEHAVRHFNRNGNIQFPGFTQAMPVAQALYGAAWSRLFGDSSGSFDLSTATLAIFGGLLFYILARKCGAAPWSSAVATALLICNPCYLFLSFSFMTEIPFLVAIIASYLAFACAINGSKRRRLWLAGGVAAVGFAIRPFAAATIAGETAALLAAAGCLNGQQRRLKMTRAVPLFAAMITCAAFWIWLTRLHPRPWMLEYHEQRVRNYFMLVPLRAYLARGVLEPAIYLGIVLSPLAVLHTIRNWRRSLVITGAVVGASIIISRLSHQPLWNPDLACFGGSSRALVLSGMPPQDYSTGLASALLVLGAIGFAGICNAWCITFQNTNYVVRAILFAAVIYWIAMPLLWLFSDRYDLVLVPAGCLPLAAAPLPRRPLATMVSSLMTAGLAFVSAGGLISYHRSMQTIAMETEALLRQGIPRRQIDAGYTLNGRDLYVYPAERMDTAGSEPPIPLITGSPVVPYVLSTSPIPNMTIWRRFSGCGPLGFGRRPLFVLRATNRSSLP